MNTSVELNFVVLVADVIIIVAVGIKARAIRTIITTIWTIAHARTVVNAPEHFLIARKTAFTVIASLDTLAT